MNRAISLYLLRLSSEVGVPDVWIVKNGWRTWLVGENPLSSLISHMRMCVPGCHDVDAAAVRKFVNGMGLNFLAKQIIDIDEYGAVRTVKNRYGRDAVRPPFTSLPEAKLVSAARGWPDPVELEDLFHGDASV